MQKTPARKLLADAVIENAVGFSQPDRRNFFMPGIEGLTRAITMAKTGKEVDCTGMKGIAASQSLLSREPF